MKLCMSVAKKLTQLGTAGDFTSQDQSLLFPKYMNGNKRISEQESRVLFCREIEEIDHKKMYSIETPTRTTLHLSGTRSALFDLSIYGKDSEIIEVNVEFKKNIQYQSIEKDIHKLLLDQPDEFENITSGIFFHTLKSIDGGSLITGQNDEIYLGGNRGLFVKYKQSILTTIEEADPEIIQRIIRRDNNKKEKWFLLFFVCIINTSPHVLWKIFDSSLLSNDNNKIRANKIKEFFKFDYSVSNNEITITYKNGWNSEYPPNL